VDLAHRSYRQARPGFRRSRQLTAGCCSDTFAVDRTGVAASHGDDEIGRYGELVGEGFGKFSDGSRPTSPMGYT
jgi:hypothetical protein